MQFRNWRVFLHRFIGVSAPATLLAGCVPFLADHQSARILPRGEVEVTPSFSYVSYSEDGETEHIQDQYGARLGIGIAQHVDFRATFEHISVDDGSSFSSDLERWALRPEFGLVKNPGELGITWGFTLGVSIRPTVR
jgi:hypothetical protein